MSAKNFNVFVSEKKFPHNYCCAVDTFTQQLEYLSR